MIMKDKIVTLLRRGVLRTNWDMAIELGTTEATVRARISDLRKEGEPLVAAKVKDVTYRKGWTVAA